MQHINEALVHFLLRYVSTQYIHDCIEKDEQLDLEDYRLNLQVDHRQSPRRRNRKELSPSGSGGII